MNIKFGVKLGKTPTETHEMLQTVYGDEALSRSSVLEWFKRFKDGSEDLHPLEMQTQSQMSVNQLTPLS
jgi:hypothetical protein